MLYGEKHTIGKEKISLTGSLLMVRQHANIHLNTCILKGYKNIVFLENNKNEQENVIHQLIMRSVNIEKKIY